MDQDSRESSLNDSTTNSDGDKQILAPSEGPREHLISTAVKFLQNPKVMSSPLYQKKAFLEKKGLTQEEIGIAVERSGVKENVGSDVTAAQGPPPGYRPDVMNGGTSMAVAPMYAPIPPQSGWAKMRDLTMTTVVVASVSYAVYQLFQKYLRPLLLGKTSQEKRMERLESKVVDIQKSVSDSLGELNKTLAAMQASLQNQQPQFPVMNNDRGISDLKADIASLKGLLLNRNQFPPAPSISPVLPAWQRAQPLPTATETAASPSPLAGQTSSASLASDADSATTVKDEGESRVAAETPNGVSTDLSDETNHNSSSLTESMSQEGGSGQNQDLSATQGMGLSSNGSSDAL
ncbi:peroxisomal membrane protein PEX14 isoform X2 [Aplysia californica]|nr:peroxisomal membrane protein PEX14 isoform X2 [Aplysia californica]XP_012943043.1 peroxisomal membrane protein PEX14 isoform X2 [Aplysia californica]XP_012943044.1 peroxisomal membrane protein PEX14 isoform X2 [Aplysia californica]XP_035828081.1 peroxisomal membrane protein PEX14 isoform X2 [Aplysia californica]XP_035828082.1 peroxisomal membrane protein PEX14 isoform X2 [Aplysia californica]